MCSKSTFAVPESVVAHQDPDGELWESVGECWRVDVDVDVCVWMAQMA